MNYRRNNFSCRNNTNTLGAEMEQMLRRHVHEVQGSVQIAEMDDPHNHRFATVTGVPMPTENNNHFHEITFHTDNYEDHCHEFCGRTGGAIRVGDRHVHALMSITSVSDEHAHKFRMSTFIQDPIED